MLVSFDAETVFRHADKVSPGGVIIFDSSLSKTVLEEYLQLILKQIREYANYCRTLDSQLV